MFHWFSKEINNSYRSRWIFITIFAISLQGILFSIKIDSISRCSSCSNKISLLFSRWGMKIHMPTGTNTPDSSNCSCCVCFLSTQYNKGQNQRKHWQPWLIAWLHKVNIVARYVKFQNHKKPFTFFFERPINLHPALWTPKL